MTGEGNGAGPAFGVPDSPPLGDGWVVGPATLPRSLREE